MEQKITKPTKLTKVGANVESPLLRQIDLARKSRGGCSRAAFVRLAIIRLLDESRTKIAV